MSAGEHPSDHPGGPHRSEYDKPRHQHSGQSASSPPRRPGTGERQAPRRRHVDDACPTEPVVPGQVFHGDEPVVINAGADAVSLRVENTGDRPIQVGSHYHFAEVNPALEFDRKAAWGRRLDVLSGGSVRFEPGAVEEVALIPIRGKRIVAGLRGEAGGPLDG